MDRQEVRKGLEEILPVVKEDFSGAEDISDETGIANELGLDSLQITEMLFEIEDKFGARISDEEARNITTVGELITIIQQKVEQGPG